MEIYEKSGEGEGGGGGTGFRGGVGLIDSEKVLGFS